jgi:hypothetical protein
MDENDRKERFSLAYISAVAAHAGFLVTEPGGPDKISIDGFIMSDEDRQPIVPFQAKATTRRVGRASNISFPLPVKNYNDLRADVFGSRLLIVVFLPADEAEWLTHSEAELRLRRCGYWVSLAGKPEKPNRRTVSVRIPRSQVFDTAQLRELMGRANRGEPLWR